MRHPGRSLTPLSVLENGWGKEGWILGVRRSKDVGSGTAEGGRNGQLLGLKGVSRSSQARKSGWDVHNTKRLCEDGRFDAGVEAPEGKPCRHKAEFDSLRLFASDVDNADRDEEEQVKKGGSVREVCSHEVY